MAGHVITMHLIKTQVLVFNVSRRSRLNRHTALMDVMDIGRLDEYLQETSPDVIVNCIGVLNQFASAEKDRAVFLNSYLPHYLESKYKGRAPGLFIAPTACSRERTVVIMKLL